MSCQEGLMAQSSAGVVLYGGDILVVYPWCEHILVVWCSNGEAWCVWVMEGGR